MRTEDLVRVGEALREEQPDVALFAVARSLLAQGYSRKELADALEDYREHLPEKAHREDDDRILDIIAVLDGWASDTAVRNILPPPCVAPQATSLS
jgi:hypothetical protein